MTGERVQEPLEPELGSLVVDAAQAARRFAADNAALVDRAARLEVPAFETNEVGLPRVVADRYSLAGPRSGPTDWRFLFSAKKAGIVAFGADSVPELQHVIDYVAANVAVARKVSHFPTIAGEALAEQLPSDAVELVTKVAGRAEALGVAIENRAEHTRIYAELARGLFAPQLEAKILVPVLGGTFAAVGAISLSAEVTLEPISPELQRARAPRMNDTDGINPFLIASATHMLVIHNRILDNERGFVVRAIEQDVRPPNLDEVDRAIQALELASNANLGYSQICIQPVGWAVKWISDLPPIERVRTLRRYPPTLDDGSWNKAKDAIADDLVEEAAGFVAGLSPENRRGRLAARRLIQATLRDDDDDVTLDTCIGIEALVGLEFTELQHRMGLRTATALRDKVDPKLAYDLLIKVYKHRSAIAHGSESKYGATAMEENGEKYRTSSIADFLLRSLLKSQLTVSPPWTPEQLDTQLLDELRSKRADGT